MLRTRHQTRREKEEASCSHSGLKRNSGFSWKRISVAAELARKCLWTPSRVSATTLLSATSITHQRWRSADDIEKELAPPWPPSPSRTSLIPPRVSAEHYTLFGNLSWANPEFAFLCLLGTYFLIFCFVSGFVWASFAVFCCLLPLLCFVSIFVPCRVVSCSAVQCRAVQCRVVQCRTVRCSAVLCRAMQCSAVQCSAVQCRAVQCRTVSCSAVQCSVVPFRSVPCRAVQCSAVPCRAVPYSVVACCGVFLTVVI